MSLNPATVYCMDVKEKRKKKKEKKEKRKK
jgi:hypothetical protein